MEDILWFKHSNFLIIAIQLNLFNIYFRLQLSTVYVFGKFDFLNVFYCL